MVLVLVQGKHKTTLLSNEGQALGILFIHDAGLNAATA
jgi:hypothetical protein